MLAGRNFLQSLGVDHPRIHPNDGDAQALLFGGVGWVAVGRRGGLGQTITFKIAQSIQLPQTLRHRLGHGRTTAAYDHQAGEVVLVELGAAQQVDDHGGDVGPMGHAVARNQRSCIVAVPARHQHHACTQVDAAVHDRDQARDVEHGHDAQTDVFMRAVVPNCATHRVVHDAAVRVHTALGQTGGAAGVGQYGQVRRRNS